MSSRKKMKGRNPQFKQIGENGIGRKRCNYKWVALNASVWTYAWIQSVHIIYVAACGKNKEKFWSVSKLLKVPQLQLCHVHKVESLNSVSF